MKEENKKCKLRMLTCTVCNKDFYRHISPSQFYNDQKRVCSIECKKALNSLRKRKGEERPCEVCGKPVLRSPSKIKKGHGRYCSRKCRYANCKNISVDGYMTTSEDGRKQEKAHRVIYENHYNIKLTSEDIIHHINFNKLDNRIENLEKMTRAEHNVLHHTKG